MASQIRGGCTFIVDPVDDDAMSLRPLISNFGRVIVGNEADKIAKEIRALGLRPEGVVTFSEARIELAIELADIFGLSRLISGNPAVLVDKFLQRAHLNAVFREKTFSTILSEVTDSAIVPYPNVIKPRRGAGSTNTIFTLNPSDLEMARSGITSQDEYVLEEALIGAKGAMGNWLADNMSVESVVQAGEISVLGFSGRLPLAEPARDTGLIFPIDIPSPLKEMVIEANRLSIIATQIHQGIVHAEFKICEDGPRVLEVNGRLGGGLARIMPLTLHLDPVEIAVSLSANVRVDIESTRMLTYGVAGHLYVQAPKDAVKVLALPTLSEVRSIKDVVRVDRRTNVGAALDWRSGTNGRVFDVWIHSSTLEELQTSAELVNEIILDRSIWGTSSKSPELIAGDPKQFSN
jgi:hypothetical protein